MTQNKRLFGNILHKMRTITLSNNTQTEKKFITQKWVRNDSKKNQQFFFTCISIGKDILAQFKNPGVIRLK